MKVTYLLVFVISFFLLQVESAIGKPIGEYPYFIAYDHIEDDYKVHENGKITLAQQTNDTFDRLILVSGKKGKINYSSKDGSIKNPHILIKKGILSKKKPLKGNVNRDRFKGLKLDFQYDLKAAKHVFEFLADYTLVEWSLLYFEINQQSRSSIYTSYRNDMEFFGSLKVHHLINCPLVISTLKHYHNHPRTPVEAVGKYAFPSNSDLDFRNNILKIGIPNLEFRIRTDGIYVDYGNPQEWNKSNGEDWM